MDLKKDLDTVLQQRSALLRQLDQITGIAKYIEEKIREQQEAALAEHKNEVAEAACQKLDSPN